MKRTVLITGGCGGIARAIVEALQDGYRVLAPSRHELDVTDLTAVRGYLAGRGKIDVLVNNAGTIHPARVFDSDPEEWTEDVRVNLIGPYYLTRETLLCGCTCIINSSSTAGYAAYKEWSAYCAAKAGLITLTKSLAAEGVAAYAICPGATDTRFRDNLGLANDSLQNPREVGRLVVEILDGRYRPGDSILIRKGQLEVR